MFYLFAFSYCSWGSQGKNSEVACHSLLQWTTFCHILSVYDPAIPLLEKMIIQNDTCTPMFTEAPFTIARTWKQPRRPLADGWKRKLCYIYTKEHYSAIKKNAFESVLMRWMKLEPIIPSEVSQKEKHQYSILTHIYGI